MGQDSSTSPISAGKTPRRSSKVVIPHRPTWYQHLAAILVFLVIRSVSATLRYRISPRMDSCGVPDTGPLIYCVWHNRLAMCMPAYRKLAILRSPTQGLAALVSASKDGALLSRILQAFGVQPARGSSSRRGSQALLELTGWAEKGWDIAITPDGPRGPKYQVQPGVISLAQVTGLVVLPVSINFGWKVCVKSWDRFQIPVPFSRCEVKLGQAVKVPRDATDEAREASRLELQTRLCQMMDE